MKWRIYKRNLLKDKYAISEEFTSLPALSVVMIGFALFILLIANTYSAYNTRIDRLEKYKTADLIASKLTNPDCFFIKEGGIIDLPLLNDDLISSEKLNKLREKYQVTGIDFIVRISYDSTYKDFPEDLPNNTGDRVAVSRSMSIYINEAQTRPGALTVISWRI